MVACLTNAWCWLQLKSNESPCKLAGLESLLNPCALLDAQLNPVLEPEVGSSLDGK